MIGTKRVSEYLENFERANGKKTKRYYQIPTALAMLSSSNWHVYSDLVSQLKFPLLLEGFPAVLDPGIVDVRGNNVVRHRKSYKHRIR